MLSVITLQVPGSCQIFFNISANVGPGCRNDVVDVQLVQLGYACAAKNGRSTASSATKAVFAQVRPGAAYSGQATDPLSRAIVEDQRARGRALDGHVSRMVGTTTSYAGANGSQAYQIAALCNNIADVMADAWPRIDKGPGCPPALAAAIRALFRN